MTLSPMPVGKLSVTLAAFIVALAAYAVVGAQDPEDDGYEEPVPVHVSIWQDVDQLDLIHVSLEFDPVERDGTFSPMPADAFPVPGYPEDEGPYLRYTFRVLCPAPAGVAEEDRAVVFVFWIHPTETEDWRSVGLFQTGEDQPWTEALPFDLLLFAIDTAEGPIFEHRVGQLGFEIRCPSSYRPPSISEEVEHEAPVVGDTGTGLREEEPCLHR